jgi:hypothetical protein
MGFLERLRSSATRSREPLTFSAVVESGNYKAKDGVTLWRNGYAIVDPHDGSFLRWDAPEITDAGAMICRVAGVSHRPNELQQDEFSPGKPLVLRPEPDNPHDRNAVGVWDPAGRTQVGFVPREQAKQVADTFRRREPLGALVLQELRETHDGDRVALVLLVCPLGGVNLVVEDARGTAVRSGPEAEGQRPRHIPSSGPGTVRGRHFTEYVETVKELRRMGDEEAAEHLLFELLDATETEARTHDWGVAPWYYEQLAILYRKQGTPEKEVEILERYAAQQHAPGASPPKLLARLEKAKAKLRE